MSEAKDFFQAMEKQFGRVNDAVDSFFESYADLTSEFANPASRQDLLENFSKHAEAVSKKDPETGAVLASVSEQLLKIGTHGQMKDLSTMASFEFARRASNKANAMENPLTAAATIRVINNVAPTFVPG